jgi:hypothetical protein
MDEEDGTGPLFGIACTNMYGCWELWDGDAEPGPQEIYGMVCDVGSRINHRLDSGFFNGNLLTTTHQHSCQLGLSTGAGLYGLPVGLPMGIPAKTLTCRSRLPVAAGP